MKLSAALVLMPLFVATLSQQIVPTTSLPTSSSMISALGGGLTNGLNLAKGTLDLAKQLYYPAPTYIVHNHHHHTIVVDDTPVVVDDTNTQPDWVEKEQANSDELWRRLMMKKMEELEEESMVSKRKMEDMEEELMISKEKRRQLEEKLEDLGMKQYLYGFVKDQVLDVMVNQALKYGIPAALAYVTLPQVFPSQTKKLQRPKEFPFCGEARNGERGDQWCRWREELSKV